LGRDAGPIPFGFSGMTQAPGVPKWGADMDMPSTAQASRVCWGVPRPRAGSPRAMCAQGCTQH